MVTGESGVRYEGTYEYVCIAICFELMIMIGQFSQHVEDVDLFSGGLAERPLSGAVVGPTFGCLLGQQFEILKKGDRFWYENNIPPSALSKGELAVGGRERGTGLIKHTIRQFHGTITSVS